MSDFDNFYNRLPKRIIVTGFAVALLLDLVPLPQHIFFWLPEFTLMILLYWLINRPQTIGIGISFLCGLIVDVGMAAPLGQHALAYMLVAYAVQQYQQRISVRSYGEQAVVILLALSGSQIVLALVRLMYDHKFPDWFAFVSPVVGAFLWPLLNKLMLRLLNARRTR